MTATIITADTIPEEVRAILRAVPIERLRADLQDLQDQVVACKGGPAADGPSDPAPPGAFEALVHVIGALGYRLACGIAFDPKLMAQHAAGNTDTRHHVVMIHSELHGWQAVSVLAHEAAHVLLPPNESTLLDEIAAESVAYLVCHELGLQSDKFARYICAECARRPDEPVHASCECIVVAAETILDFAADFVPFADFVTTA